MTPKQERGEYRARPGEVVARASYDTLDGERMWINVPKNACRADGHEEVRVAFMSRMGRDIIATDNMRFYGMCLMMRVPDGAAA